MVKIISDSTCDLSPELVNRYDIDILPLHILLGEKEYKDGKNITPDEIFAWSDAHKTTPKTSAPSLVDAIEILKPYVEEKKEVICFSISSSMSTSGNVMRLAADELEASDFVTVIDSANLSTGIGLQVVEAAVMAQAGKSAAEIKKILTDQKLDSSIYITLDTLKYLKKGGRITPAAAAIGTVLNLKPVLQIQGEKLDAYAKVRGKKQAKRAMLKAMKNDWETRFKEYASDGEMCLQAAYTGNLEEAEEFKKEIQEVFPGMEIHMDPLSLSVACHIGYGALAVACSRKVTL